METSKSNLIGRVHNIMNSWRQRYTYKLDLYIIEGIGNTTDLKRLHITIHYSLDNCESSMNFECSTTLLTMIYSQSVIKCQYSQYLEPPPLLG